MTIPFVAVSNFLYDSFVLYDGYVYMYEFYLCDFFRVQKAAECENLKVCNCVFIYYLDWNRC